VFAAWIFLSFLQQRYVAAFERFRELTNEYRGAESPRHESVRTQIRLATNIGVVSAILLLCTLMMGGLNVVFPGHKMLPPVAAAFALGGLTLVVVSAVIVLIENTLIGFALSEDVADLPGI
jgi:hypothetical protein